MYFYVTLYRILFVFAFAFNASDQIGSLTLSNKNVVRNKLNLAFERTRTNDLIHNAFAISYMHIRHM